MGFKMVVPIADLLPRILSQDHQWKYQLLRNWQSIFGSMSNKLYLEKIIGDILILAVYDACWMHEFHALSSVLINSINKTLEKPYVKQLRFKRAGIKESKKSIKKIKDYGSIDYNVKLSTEEQKAIARINDPQLALELRNFLMRCYHERRLYESKSNNSSRTCVM